MLNLGKSPIRYTPSWPPTSNFNSVKPKKKTPINRGSIPSGIKYINQTPVVDTNSISRVYNSCDCKELQTQIKKLKDENLTLNDMLESHMTVLKKSKEGGSKRSRKYRTSRRKYNHKYRNTRVRR